MYKVITCYTCSNPVEQSRAWWKIPRCKVCLPTGSYKFDYYNDQTAWRDAGAPKDWDPEP